MIEARMCLVAALTCLWAGQAMAQGAWDFFAERCLGPLEQGRLPVTEGLSDTAAGGFQVWEQAETGLRLEIQADGAPICSVSVPPGQDAPLAEGMALWARDGVANGRYRVLRGEGDVVSAAWRNPPLRVQFIPGKPPFRARAFAGDWHEN